MAGRVYEMAKRTHSNGALDKLARKIQVSLPHYEVISITTFLRNNRQRTSELCFSGVLRHRTDQTLKHIGSYDQLTACLWRGYKLQWDHPEWSGVTRLECDVLIIANPKVTP